MRRATLMCSTAVMIVASLPPGNAGAPAASPVYFFQGVPGRLLDFCIDGVEMATAVSFDSIEHAVTFAPSTTKHWYSLREPARGACDGALVDEGSFYAYGGDRVIVLAHQWSDGSARSEPQWLPARPRIRRGETRFVVGHYAAAPRLRMAIDGTRIKHLGLHSGGPSYLFRGYAAGTHTFAFRTKASRELIVRRALSMPKGVEFLLVIYGDRASGYGLRVFSRKVGVRQVGGSVSVDRGRPVMSRLPS
jgi:hypothetical protein